MFDPRSNTHTTWQTLRDVVEQRWLERNTPHRALRTRLSVSRPTPGFPGMYRPEGILFTTDQSPAYCVPFDMMALTRGRTLTSRDYADKFLPGYEKFVFPDFEAMTEAFPTYRQALESLNDFRASHGLTPVNVSYNEVCFEEDVKIEPVAVVGTSLALKAVGWDHKLKRYADVDTYLLSQSQRPVKYALRQAFNLFVESLSSMNELGVSALAPERECDFA